MYTVSQNKKENNHQFRFFQMFQHLKWVITQYTVDYCTELLVYKMTWRNTDVKWFNLEHSHCNKL